MFKEHSAVQLVADLTVRGWNGEEVPLRAGTCGTVLFSEDPQASGRSETFYQIEFMQDLKTVAIAWVAESSLKQ